MPSSSAEPQVVGDLCMYSECYVGVSLPPCWSTWTWRKTRVVSHCNLATLPRALA
ncbi:hypothetical protein U1Q18_050428, partial [Sarracenia purpurea var. burkii]